MSAEQAHVPTILLPEAQDPVVQQLQAENLSPDQIGANLRFEADMPLADAAKLLREGEVDIVIAGVVSDSADVIRTAVKDINRVEQPDRRDTITSFFVMEKDDEDPLFFADCAVHEKPDPDTLVTIAEQTCESVSHLGYEPVVAFVSLSTFGSAEHLESVQAIKQAADTFKEKNPDIIAYGEIQVDAALDERIFKKKAAKAGIELVDGKLPNVLIFPDGQSGNIAYKLVEQLAGRTALGPFLNGVYKDLHDSSRGVRPEALKRMCEISALLYVARTAARNEKEELVA